MEPIKNSDRALCRSLIQGNRFCAVDGTVWRVNGTKEEKLPGLYFRTNTYSVSFQSAPFPVPPALNANEEPVNEREKFSEWKSGNTSLAACWLTSKGAITVSINRRAIEEERKHDLHLVILIEESDDFDYEYKESCHLEYEKKYQAYDEYKYYETVLPYWENIVCASHVSGGIIGIDRTGKVHYCFPKYRNSGCYSFKLFESLYTAREQLDRTRELWEKAREKCAHNYEALNNEYQSVLKRYAQASGRNNKRKLQEMAIEVRELNARLKYMGFCFPDNADNQKAYEKEREARCSQEITKSKIQCDALRVKTSKNNKFHSSVDRVITWMLDHPLLLFFYCVIGIPILLILMLCRKIIEHRLEGFKQALALLNSG